MKPDGNQLLLNKLLDTCQGSNCKRDDIAFDAGIEKMRPLRADLGQAGAVCAVRDGGIERIERDRLIGIALHALPELPDFNGSCDLVARRYSADPAEQSWAPI